jgi:hypothetical protein
LILLGESPKVPSLGPHAKSIHPLFIIFYPGSPTTINNSIAPTPIHSLGFGRIRRRRGEDEFFWQNEGI